MTAFLLSVHILAAIVFIGPLTAAASLLPRYARAAAADRAGPARGVVLLLHRISSGYAVAGLVVPVFGIATATRMGVFDEVWLWASMALTTTAAVLLATVIVPVQRRVLAALQHPVVDGVGQDIDPHLRRLGMLTGLFAVAWAVVVVLMIVRPGSTTGVSS